MAFLRASGLVSIAVLHAGWGHSHRGWIGCAAYGISWYVLVVTLVITAQQYVFIHFVAVAERENEASRSGLARAQRAARWLLYTEGQLDGVLAEVRGAKHAEGCAPEPPAVALGP